MKTPRLLATSFFFVLTAGLLVPASVRAQDDTITPDTTTTTQDTTATDDSTPSFDYFYNALQDYGQWVQIDPYGYCWQPTAAQDPNWQPYTDGYWAYTDAGWTWVSYEDFGWITYHYGRWTQVDGAGWVWVPDYQWAPAWVSWRVSRDFNAPPDASFIGWAPLPPEAQFSADVGFSSWVDAAYDIGPGFYNFCRVRDFGAPVLGPVIIDRSKNIFIINSTANITNITTNNNIVYVGGPSYVALSRRTSHPIGVLKLVRQTDPRIFRQNGPKGMLAQAKGNQLIVAAPMIVAPKPGFKPAKVARVFDKPVINKGWSGVDPKQKLQLQTAIKAQTKGIKPNQPAKHITADQLAVIPKVAAAATPAPGQPTPPPRGKNLKPALVPGNPATTPAPGQPTPTPPAGKPRPKPSLAPFNPNAGGTPLPKNTPPVKTPVPQPNAAELEKARQLQEQQAAQAAKQQQAAQAAAAAQAAKQQQAAAAAQAAKQQQAEAAAQAARQQQQPPPQLPRQPGGGPVPPGGKPTPTPTPH